MRVLSIEACPVMSSNIRLVLSHAGLKVHTANSGQDGIHLAKHYNHNLILLEFELPDMTGHDVLRQLRHARTSTPVMVLAKMNDAENKLKAFSLGADNYLSKPFHCKELTARTYAIVRRTDSHASQPSRSAQ